MTARIEELYVRLDDDLEDYEEALGLLATGEDVSGDILQSIAARIRSGAQECAGIEGCDPGRFLEAQDSLLDEQTRLLMDQASRIERLNNPPEEAMEEFEEDIEREQGTSPFVSAMPDLGKSVSLLKGTDLSEIIELNGPVKAALDDWLTWLRPQLMESYENYMYLRSKMAPIYEEAGLPEALLFAIMSSETFGKVHSYSRAGAVGPLQFIRRTGRAYGLKVVDGFDMRLDPEAATRANVAYLNDRFRELNNDLPMAIAAYNGGENRMRRYHRRYKGASVFDNRIYYRIPRETREYVPRVLAAAWLFLHPEDYNLEWPVLETDKTVLTVKKDISLGELTICLGQEGNSKGWFRTLRNLNPRLNPGERVKAGESIEIPTALVPLYESQCLEGNLITTAEALHDANYPFGDMITYIVQRGDTVGRIASRHRCVTTRELAAINNIRGPRYLIRVGQRLRIPNCGF
jgi:membrane-bound lytic murein transglycosylase D